MTLIMQFCFRTTTVQVTLPQNFTCDHCIFQLIRQAGEWVANGGYVFWSCADISIQDNASLFRLNCCCYF